MLMFMFVIVRLLGYYVKSNESKKSTLGPVDYCKIPETVFTFGHLNGTDIMK